MPIYIFSFFLNLNISGIFFPKAPRFSGGGITILKFRLHLVMLTHKQHKNCTRDGVSSVIVKQFEGK